MKGDKNGAAFFVSFGTFGDTRLALVKGTGEVRHLALVGEAFRLLKSLAQAGRMPTYARGRCPQKNKIALFVKGETTITVPINHSLALVGEAFRLLKSPLKRAAPADARGRCPQKNKLTMTTMKAPSLFLPLSSLTTMNGVVIVSAVVFIDDNEGTVIVSMPLSLTTKMVSSLFLSLSIVTTKAALRLLSIVDN